MTIGEHDAWAVLASVPGLGPAGFAALLRSSGSASLVLERAATDDRSPTVPDDPTGAMGSRERRLPQPVRDALARIAREPAPILGRLAQAGVTWITIDEPGYPERLRALEEPPPVLFLQGDPRALAMARAVAVVGTRRPTEAGRAVAARIADALARVGAVVVSGLAIGIDGAAHAAVVGSGRRTIAVLGSGHGRLFPRAHARLAMEIVGSGGALVSELGPDVEPTRGTFPRRNRVISGLAEAVVVVEAADRSGALITARWALEQGRGCFLVPGSIDAPASRGCNAFLREFAGAARIVAGIPELLEDLELVGPTERREGSRATPPPGAAVGPIPLDAIVATLGVAEGRVARAVARGTTTVDELAASTDLPAATVLGALTMLEVRRLVVAAYGRYRPAGPLAVVASTAAGLPPDGTQ